MTLKDPDSLFSHLLPPPGRREPTAPADFQHCPSLSWSVWWVPSIDRPPTAIALPRDCSERLPFFGEPHLFFKWPYLSLKKMRHLGTMGAGFSFVCLFLFCFFETLCASLLDLLSKRRHFFFVLRTLGICCLVLLAGGVSIMSRLLCLKNVALAVSVSDLSCSHWSISRATVPAATTVVVFY